MTRSNTARAAGAVYVALAALSIFSFLYVPSVIVTSDPGSTASIVDSSHSLVRMGIFGGLMAMVLFVVLVITLHELLAPVHRAAARLMVALVLVGVSVEIVGLFLQFQVLMLLSGVDFLSPFSTSQLEALAHGLMRSRGDISAANHWFSGLWLLPFGLLVIRSGFVPRVLGFLLLAAGASYTASSALSILLPGARDSLAPLLSLLAAGELPIIVWLLLGRAGPVAPATMPPATARQAQ